MLRLYNTLGRRKEVFKPIKDRRVGLYTCGPTVYWFAHIGNLRTYIFEDTLKRVLQYNGYSVKHVMNITDVGHLTSDADTGEDKLEKGAKREKKSVWEIAKFYLWHFKKDIKDLNIIKPDIWIRATKTIREQINLIKILEKKGYTYIIKDGVYFDTSKLGDYGRLWPKKMKIKGGARVEMVKGKKQPTDFALWKFSPPGAKRQMEWDSPWSPPGSHHKVKGFPGWHTECVVMSIKELGIPFDIHCGGIDHILIHHTNEIAQAEAAYGKLMANYWLHGEFLTVNGGKMAKSKRNIYILEDISKRGFHPLAYRYLCLGARYRSKLNFSWKSLKASQMSLENLYQKVMEIREVPQRKNLQRSDLCKTGLCEDYREKFLKFINDDLNTPRALALMWDLIGDKNISKKEKFGLLLDFDRVFGFGLDKIRKPRVPKKIREMLELREAYRKKGGFKEADRVRKMIREAGYQVEDTSKGPRVKPLN